MKIIPGILVSVALAATAATAQADSGVYISGGLNSTTNEHTVSRNTGTNVPISADTGAANGGSFSSFDKDTGASFYVALGYRLEALADNFLEVELFYADENAETRNLNSLIISDVELSSSYGVDLHLGKQITDTFGVYGLVGVAQYEFDVDQSYPFAPPTASVSGEETAFIYGAGVTIALTDKLSTFGEVRLANDIEFDTPADQGGVISQNELDFNVIRTGLRYQF